MRTGLGFLLGVLLIPVCVGGQTSTGVLDQASQDSQRTQPVVEPDWGERFQEIKKAEIRRFTSPLGQQIVLVLRSGDTCTGSVSGITSDMVSVTPAAGRKTTLMFPAGQLTQETCEKVFADVWAAKAAGQKLAEEQRVYREKKQIEDEKKKQEEIAREEEARAEADRLAKGLQQEKIRRENEKRMEELREGKEWKTLLVLLVLGLCLYLVPSVIAFKRRHHNAVAIAALNLLLGWTVFGWVAALVWSVARAGKPRPVR